MVADMVAFVASQFTTSTWDVGAQELCSVVLINCEVGEDGLGKLGWTKFPSQLRIFEILVTTN